MKKCIDFSIQNNYNNYVLQPYNDLTKQAIANDDQSFLSYLQKLGY